MIKEENGMAVYHGDTFKVTLARYTDPSRLNAARNAALYLGKKDIDNIKRPLNIIKQGHVPEVFRGEFAEFIFEDVSKEVYDHLATYTTRNLRVAGGNRALRSEGVTLPSDKVKDIELVRKKAEASMQNYYDLLDAKETPQVARSAMPTSAKLNTFVYQFNFLTLGQAVFKQRIWEKGAQGNTVKVVQAMYELVHSVDPELWDTFYDWHGEPAAEWIEVRRKINKSQLTVDSLIEMLELSKQGKLADKKGNPLHQANGDDLVFDALRAIFGEQKSMW